MALSIHTACSLPPSEALPELTLQGFSPSTLHARSFQRSSPQPISIYFPWFPVRPRCMQLSPSYFHGFLSVHAPVSSCLLPSRRSRPLFLWFPSSTLHARSLPVQPQAIFPRFLVRPRYMLAPFPWSSPQAISDSFLSVEVSPSYFPRTVSCPQATAISVRPRYVLAPSQRNSPQARCMLTLSPSYFLQFPLSVHAAFSLLSLPPNGPRFPVRP